VTVQQVLRAGRSMHYIVFGLASHDCISWASEIDVEQFDNFLWGSLMSASALLHRWLNKPPKSLMTLLNTSYNVLYFSNCKTYRTAQWPQVRTFSCQFQVKLAMVCASTVLGDRRVPRTTELAAENPATRPVVLVPSFPSPCHMEFTSDPPTTFIPFQMFSVSWCLIDYNTTTLDVGWHRLVMVGPNESMNGLCPWACSRGDCDHSVPSAAAIGEAFCEFWTEKKKIWKSKLKVWETRAEALNLKSLLCVCMCVMWINPTLTVHHFIRNVQTWADLRPNSGFRPSGGLMLPSAANDVASKATHAAFRDFHKESRLCNSMQFARLRTSSLRTLQQCCYMISATLCFQLSSYVFTRWKCLIFFKRLNFSVNSCKLRNTSCQVPLGFAAPAVAREKHRAQDSRVWQWKGQKHAVIVQKKKVR